MTQTIEQQAQDTEIQEVCELISASAEEGFNTLLERRDDALAAAIEPLDAEEQTLRQEYRAIGEAAQNLEKLLPATSRVAQSEADRLTLAGKHKEARAKIKEAEEAANAPVAMRQRRERISQRIEAIADERQAVARRIFETWFVEVQPVIRAAEHGLFVTLLDGLKTAFYEYQQRTGTGGTIEKPYSFLVKDSHLQNLTAHGKSEEWDSSQRWYNGGRR